MKIPPAISRQIEDAIASLAPEPLGHINFDGLRYRALPLFGTIGEVWLLKADGSFWKADSETGVPLEPLPEDLEIIALVAGMKRYEWLGTLLPVRPVEAVDCDICGGSGRLGPGNTILCHGCRALGWRLNS
jgi:hypothetical protein